MLKFQHIQAKCIGASSTFQRDWIKDHYIDELINAAKIAAQKYINIKIIHDPKAHLNSKINMSQLQEDPIFIKL